MNTHPHDSVGKASTVTDEMVEAACKSYDTCVPISVPPAYPSRMRSALEAALLASPDGIGAGTVKVKMLAWRVFCSKSGSVEAEAFGDKYVVQNESGVWCLYRPYQDSPTSHHGALSDAKAAARADYEARILSAISPAPVNGEAAEADDTRQIAVDICDAVLAWIVKHDFGDRDDEFSVAEVIAVLDCLYEEEVRELQAKTAAPPSLSSRVEAAEARVAVLEKVAKSALDYLIAVYNSGDIEGHFSGEIISDLSAALASPDQVDPK